MPVRRQEHAQNKGKREHVPIPKERNMLRRRRLSTPQYDGLRRPAPFPAGALELGLGMLGLRIAEAEIADEAPMRRHFENRRDAGGIENRHPAHADSLGARRQ